MALVVEKKPTDQCRRRKRKAFDPLGRENPLEEEMMTHSSILGESHGQKSLVGYSPQGWKESDVTKMTEHTQYYI